MKCINGPYRCSRIGFSGNRECCGFLLALGETKFINSAGVINEPCPLPEEKITDTKKAFVANGKLNTAIPVITKIKKGKRVIGPDGLGTFKKYIKGTHDILVDNDDGSSALYCIEPDCDKFEAVYEVNLDPKYLKIPNICFSLLDKDDKRQKKYSQQRIKNGFDDSETWSLDLVIAQFIVPRLEKFIELSSHIVKKDCDEYTIQLWKNIDIVLEAFKLLLKEDMLNKL